ncbi:glycosyltransferase family 4 protein [Acidocella aminolytica]|jgi:UDP-GlcNAc:undecaprenyl-phosphate GlcNAc-1-phosphate transferase|uniref:Undecaprenyl-phosphate alpha-N-acetylglucosaminephosphotransferase n=1 Tax=Acidocella aminolytica 101 = DSM 11237 TaxID=1120923 RepID=A0A0D6PIM6_9PROT|nr:MraY family glycosyltransferase [Acidocella aminolytica]GAN81226.1 undecaprenyl-phosphate alpha-N-acetylglucosaminephosphotransferase [Acidocella aminolytica 101 = DSM 11237]GBQ31934.1 UDP-N-acetylmuramyl pentapeptide phosphotransferase [Acidocella aminolytica 101 = DSM 11237]SHE84944.1 UDP-GlcNAc:undecaprenyl-phosphate GlcNAc-1-phosphate transferase [Acidocella aminolytica 101 = DSM 11237]
MILTTLTALSLPRHLALMGGLAIFSGIIVRVMITIGVPDHPDARKAHSTTTPKSGGVGIVCAFLLGVLLLYRYAQVSRIAEPYFIGVIAAAVLIALVSLLDDIKNMPYKVKLGGQFVAALTAVASGLWLHSIALPYWGYVDLGWAGLPLTVGFLLFVTNSMNFIDGLNGLAAGVTLISCLFLAGIAGVLGGFFIYTASLLLAGGVLGFLPFNYPKARIFMGDVGSQFCGFMLALFGIAAARFEQVQLSFLLVPFLLSGVLYDVSFTLVRRLLAGENIARAHNGHLYQVVRRAGMNAETVAIIHWLFAGLGGLTAIAFISTPSMPRLWIGLVPLLVQAVWTFYVAARARRAGLGRWSK